MTAHRAATLALAAATLPAIAGCGSGKSYANDPRPPTPITLTAAVTASRVVVSPNAVGAGLVDIVVANETSHSRQVTLSSGGFSQATGPINPADTTSFKVQLARGRHYTLSVDSRSIPGAQITVGAPRPSAQNQLLQP